jgi:hypothetical protein
MPGHTVVARAWGVASLSQARSLGLLTEFTVLLEVHIKILIMIADNQGGAPSRVQWMTHLLTQIEQLTKSIPESYNNIETDKSLVAGRLTAQFLKTKNVSDLVTGEDYMILHQELTLHLAEAKRFAMNINSEYFEEDSNQDQFKEAILIIERSCYFATYMVNICEDVLERLETYPLVNRELIGQQEVEQQQPGQGQNQPLEQPVITNNFVKEQFLNLGRTSLESSSKLKALVLKCTNSYLNPQPSFIQGIKRSVLRYFRESMEESVLAPKPFEFVLETIRYLYIFSQAVSTQSLIEVGAFAFIEADNYWLFALFTKYFLFCLVQTWVGIILGKSRREALENGIHFNSLEFVRSYLFNAVFLGYFGTLTDGTRTWTGVLLDSIPILSFAYMDLMWQTLELNADKVKIVN